MTYDDLTEYEYGLASTLPGVKSVGWLGGSKTFRTGTLESELLSRLLDICENSTSRQTRGLHKCPFCDHQAMAGKRVLGSAEVWVKGKSCIYAAPDMIAHFVAIHHYLPPPEFVEALRGGAETVDGDVVRRTIRKTS